MTALRRVSLVQGAAGPGTFAGTGAWTPGAILNGAFASTTVAVTNAVVGVPTWAAFSAMLPDGMILWVQTISAGLVKVYLFNLSGSTQTISAGTLNVEALQS